MNNIFNILEQLEKESSTNNKIQILKNNQDNLELKKYLELALDKNITFGVSEFKPCLVTMRSNVDSVWNLFIDLTSRLINRELTGNEAQIEISIFFDLCNDIEKKWYKKCLQKDLSSIGLGQRIFEKGFEVQGFKFRLGLAEEVEALDDIEDTDGWLDKKCNGFRTTVFMNDGKVNIIYSGRNGIEATNFYFIKDELELLSKDLGEDYLNCILDGEMHVEDSAHKTTSLYGFKWRSKEEFIGSKGKIKEKAWNDYQEREIEIIEYQAKAKYVIFDFIPKGNWDSQKYDKILSERKKDLDIINKAIKKLNLKYIEIVETEYVKNKSEAVTAAQKWIEKGFEGGIFKPSYGCYQWKRWRTWIKIKSIVDFEIQITGFEKQEPKYFGDGTKKPDMIGKVLGIDKSGFIHKIGTGEVLSEKTREDMFNNPENWIGKIVTCSAQEPSKVSGKYINPRLDIVRLDRDSLKD